MPSATAKETTKPMAALRSRAPRRRSRSISSPAKNSRNARPSKASTSNGRSTSTSPRMAGPDHDTGYDLKYHGGQMQCRCEAEQERHCEGYRRYDQYARKRDIGHHKSILWVVCCLDVRSDMSVHLEEHL